MDVSNGQLQFCMMGGLKISYKKSITKKTNENISIITDKYLKTRWQD